MGGTNSTTEKAEGRISEGKNRNYPIWTTERKKSWRKKLFKNRASGICRTVTKDVTLMSLESRGRGKRTGMKNHSKKRVKTLKLGKRQKPTDRRSWANSREDKLKESP